MLKSNINKIGEDWNLSHGVQYIIKMQFYVHLFHTPFYSRYISDHKIAIVDCILVLVYLRVSPIELSD